MLFVDVGGAYSNSILCSGHHLFVQLSYPLIHIYYFYTNTIHLCDLIIGFAGYFDATLYKDVHLGTEPSKATPDLFSWYVTFVSPSYSFGIRKYT
jgi:hypothetical protein